MTLVLTWAALRRHPLSVFCALLLATLTASLFGASVPLAVLLWGVAAVLGLEVWQAVEPFALRRLACRPPTHLERERLQSALPCSQLEILVLETPDLHLGRGLRSLVISRGLFDLLEDRALLGLLSQAALPLRGASLAGELVVRLGNLPMFAARLVSLWLMKIGRVLGMLVGSSLVLPLLLWPDGFVRWSGRVFGSAIVALLGSSLLSTGLAGPGLGLLVAWAVGPGIEALLAWETRRAEQAADAATVEAGRGAELLEALETLSFADSLPEPKGALGWLLWSGTAVNDRADRLHQRLSAA